jgi:hypothetical protein
MHRPSIIERAYQMARSGEFRGASDIRRALKTEDYPTSDVNLHTHGASIVKALNQLCRNARAAEP